MISELDGLLDNSMRDATLVAAMRTGIAEFARYRDSVPLIPLSYTRTLLRKTSGFELVAMQWAAGSVSPIHDHGNSRCWVVIVEGTLDVESFERLDDGTGPIAQLGPPSRAVVPAGGLDYRMNWRELHRVRNPGNTSSYSLQVYAAPQDEYVVIDDETYHCSRAFPKYDTTFNL